MDKNELLYRIYRDTLIKNSIVFKRYLIKQFKIEMSDATNIYARIVNHQIMKYGIQLKELQDYREIVKDKVGVKIWIKNK